MIELDGETTGNAAFLNYIIGKSEYGIFILPNFKQKGYSEKIKVNKEYLQYYKNCEKAIETITPNLIGHQLGKSFLGSKYNHVLDIYIFKINKAFRLFLENQGALSNWQFPDLPEDLCLFDKKGNCILFSQSHESIFQLYKQSDEDLKLLEECGVSFKNWNCDTNSEINLKSVIKTF